ncbi:exopolysaccharide biosynthesis protein [Roseicyclus marinus]|uniref:exopolysaccharide biosynthesis protein n=1 Tax=Roseicyclus marinus TaxID=2161673 RepID=UPI0024102295|nr:exopolysaccharide biosynthesis protein [Roseicyclus marinus]MDG3040549.1 exopolysaccharide biosynthesis protein [Roseicyclus marinus]
MGGSQCTAEDSLGGLLDQVAAIAEREENPSLDSVVIAFGPRGALPLMIFVALVIVSPLSGIPLLSSFGGLTIAAIALQLALGRRRLWLPGWLSRRSIPRPRLLAALERLRPTAGFLDRHCRRRLWLLTTPPVSQAVLLVCALAGLMMPFLELLPFSSSFLAMAVTCLGFSLLTRDGLWAALALVPLGGAVWVLTGLLG